VTYSSLNLTPSRVLPVLLMLLCSFLTACSDGNNNDNNPVSTLGVPGAGNPNTVAVPAATVEGPVAGAPVLVGTFFPLAPLGYEQAEYFVSGTANAYTNVNELGSDGNWQVAPGGQADYKTRIVVIRPSDPAKFNGTVFVEWLNVSAGFDSGPDWDMVHTELMRSGYAWVGISAQQIGVDALIDGSAAAIIPGGVSGDRYDSLHHPGDSYSYDIYSQVAKAIRAPGAVSPLGNLSAQRLIAAGESQSAGYMTTYVDAFAPLHALFDGYFIHSRFNGSGPLQGDFLNPTIATPDVVRIRQDLGTPILVLQTETDHLILGYYASEQLDSPRFRLWEVAGTAHADLYTFLDNRFDTGTNPAIAAIVENDKPVPGIIECTLPVNAGPQHFVANAAVHALNAWIVDGAEPAKADRLEVAGTPAALVRDNFGNVKGGVRTPYLDVPIAVLEGEGQPQPDLSKIDEINIDNIDFCFLSGTTRLFDAATLGSLYPDNAAYINAVNTSTEEAVSKGFLLPADAKLIKDYAAGSDIFAF
jgi:hypothetical protein